MAGAIMSKWGWKSIISFAAAVLVASVLVILGAPKMIGGLVIMVYIAYRSTNRPVTNIVPSERDRLLSHGPPANQGLVYIHRGLGVGGLAVGFNVKLDQMDAALLNAARFTRLIVAPGSHQLVVGPKKLSGQFSSISEKQTAEVSFAIAAGETIVFAMAFQKTKLLRKVELERQPDVASALAKLAQVRMVASEQPAVLTQSTAARQARAAS